MRTTISLALVFTILALAAGCEHADPLDPNRIEPTLSDIQTNIFNLSCAVSGCHVGGSPNLPGVMDLRAGQARANTVGVPSIENANLLRIDPGNPDDSYLVWKIEGRPEIAGAQMPRGRPPLAQEQITAIREWIADGAPDN